MIDKTLQLDVVSAEASLFSGEVQRLSVSGEMGYLGIEPGHAPLLTLLKPGLIHLTTTEGEEDVMYVSGGTLEVKSNVVTVLADTALRGHDLDEAEAKEAANLARKRLEEVGEKLDYAHALSELAQAAAQLRLIEKMRK